MLRVHVRVCAVCVCVCVGYWLTKSKTLAERNFATNPVYHAHTTKYMPHCTHPHRTKQKFRSARLDKPEFFLGEPIHALVADFLHFGLMADVSSRPKGRGHQRRHGREPQNLQNTFHEFLFMHPPGHTDGKGWHCQRSIPVGLRLDRCARGQPCQQHPTAGVGGRDPRHGNKGRGSPPKFFREKTVKTGTSAQFLTVSEYFEVRQRPYWNPPNNLAPNACPVFRARRASAGNCPCPRTLVAGQRFEWHW